MTTTEVLIQLHEIAVADPWAAVALTTLADLATEEAPMTDI